MGVVSTVLRGEEVGGVVGETRVRRVKLRSDPIRLAATGRGWRLESCQRHSRTMVRFTATLDANQSTLSCPGELVDCLESSTTLGPVTDDSEGRRLATHTSSTRHAPDTTLSLSPTFTSSPPHLVQQRRLPEQRRPTHSAPLRPQPPLPPLLTMSSEPSSYFLSVLSSPPPLVTFDAFKKTSATYKERTTSGGILTLLISLIVALLVWTELREYLYGEAGYGFSVDRGVGHDLQLNFEYVHFLARGRRGRES
jgi:hypothetical protein